MRTATGIALVLAGTAILGAATATSAARADRSRAVGDGIRSMTAAQPARPRPRLDRIAYVLAGKAESAATAAGHLPSAPVVANLDRGEGRTMNRHAAASKSDRIKKSPATAPDDCYRDTFASQEINASDGGRARMTASSGDIACPAGGMPKRPTRQIVIDETVEIERRTPEPALIRFQAVISIDLAALGW